MINTLLKKKTKKVDVTKLVNDSRNCSTSAKEISEKFNEYFANIAENLKNGSKSKSASQSGHKEFMGPSTDKTMFLNPVSPTEVRNIIIKLKNKTTLDTKISALKIANENSNFVVAFAKIVNSSFEQGIFPEALKIAKVVPIYKEGLKTSVENYRPISLLTSLSKVYKKTNAP